MGTRQIDFTPAQWTELKGLVIQGKHAEQQLGLPIEVHNGSVKIEITDNQTSIWISE